LQETWIPGRAEAGDLGRCPWCRGRSPDRRRLRRYGGGALSPASFPIVHSETQGCDGHMVPTRGPAGHSAQAASEWGPRRSSLVR
jgi:hypothetical protein